MPIAMPILARITLCLLLLPIGLSGVAQPASAQRPNVVIVLVDDMGFSDLGCYGGEIETPNINQLAANGLRFTQFYNSGRCCPTRASLISGLHPHQVGIGHMTAPPNQPLGFTGPYQGYLNDNCVTLAEVMKSAGYHTLMTGKWHLGTNRRECWPLQRGFDRFFGGLSGAFNYFKPKDDRGLTSGNEPFDPPEGFYATGAFTDQACEMISEVRREDDRPFFLYLAYNAPHWPLNAKWQDFQKYRGRYRDGWESLMRHRLERQVAMGLFDESITAAPHVGPDWNSLSDGQRDNLDAIMAAYAGCIDSIDQNIGKLVDHLEDLGELDQTLILFLSDNGACQEGGVLGKGSEAMVRNPPPGTAGVRLGLAWANACNTPFRLYKHYLHEGGACTPMIAHWPEKISKPRRGEFVREFAYLPDIMATCLQLASAQYPPDKPDLVGKSLLPLLAGTDSGTGSPIHEEPIFFEHEGNAAVRWGDWKLVRQYQQPWELYDVSRDRAEMVDLSAKHTDRRDQMIDRWEAWASQTEVAYPERFNMYEYLRERGR